MLTFILDDEFLNSFQVLEARMMGWKFFVLSPIFAIHWGLQTPNSIRSASMSISQRKTGTKAISQAQNSRRSQNLRNHVIYTDFVSEVLSY